MKSVSVVSSELGVNTFQRRVSVSLRLLDSVLVSLLDLVVVCVVLRLRHSVSALQRLLFRKLQGFAMKVVRII